LLARFGRFRPFHHAGFAIIAIGLGCFTLLDSSSSTAVWVVLQAVVSAGLGMVVSTLLPAIQAGLSESDTATATATFAFVRSFAFVWGISIPAVVFNNQFAHLSSRISDPAATALLSDGQAYERATSAFIDSFHGVVRTEIVGVYSDSLKLAWQVAVAIAGVGFLLVFFEKEIKLRTELETEFGITQKETSKIPPLPEP